MATENPRGRGARARGGPTEEALKQAVVDVVTEKVQARVQKKADKQIEKLERVSARVQARADEQVERVADSIARKLGSTPPEVLDLWTRRAPGSRRPRYTRDDIAAAAVRIADAEGIDALSMRRLATDLGSGTMTLYHYVRTKDELLALVTDAVMGEVVLADGELPADDWRAAVTLVAERTRDCLLAHPWIFDIVDDPAAGPNGVRHFDQTMQAVAALPGTLGDKLDLIYALDEYTFGYCLHRREDVAAGGTAHADAWMMRYVGDLVAQGGYPAMEALVAEHGLEPTWTLMEEHGRDPDRFRRNLDRLLDGVEAALAKRS